MGAGLIPRLAFGAVLVVVAGEIAVLALGTVRNTWRLPLFPRLCALASHLPRRPSFADAV